MLAKILSVLVKFSYVLAKISSVLAKILPVLVKFSSVLAIISSVLVGNCYFVSRQHRYFQ